MSEVRYAVFARRPDRRGGFRLECVGSAWDEPGPCESHQAYCRDRAVSIGDTDVEYVVCEIRPVAGRVGEEIQ